MLSLTGNLPCLNLSFTPIFHIASFILSIFSWFTAILHHIAVCLPISFVSPPFSLAPASAVPSPFFLPLFSLAPALVALLLPFVSPLFSPAPASAALLTSFVSTLSSLASASAPPQPCIIYESAAVFYRSGKHNRCQCEE
jgi:hypothetical protein